MPGFLGGNKAAAGGVPPGMNLKNALIQAAPLFASMAAGYSSGRGPYAYMDQGIASIQANQKAKRDEEAAAAAAAAFGNLRPGGMGAAGGGGGGGGTPFVYEPSKPMPKADLGGISGMGEAGIGFAGLPKADMGMLGATDGLGFTVPGSGDPTLGLIKSFEGFRETPYWDVNALRTGYGSDTVTLPDGTVQKVGEGTRVSQEDADRDLQRRVSTEFAPIAARAVGEDVFASLLPNQKAALTSIAYNYGELPSSVAEAVRSGDPQAAAAAIAALGSHNNGINAGRRSKEAAFYLSGSTGGGTAPAAPAGPVDPMSDPYVQQLMAVMSMDGITPEQQAVIQMQLQSRIGMLTAPQPGAEEEAARAMRARDADLLGYTRGSPEWNQYVVTGEMPKPAEPAKPYSSAGEIQADLRAGFITQDQADAAMGKIGGGVTVNNDLGGTGKQVYDTIAASADKASTAAVGINSLAEAKKALDGGAITGFAADQRLYLQKLGSYLGISDPAAIENTETFRAAIAPQVSAMIKATVGSANISNSDREFAEKAAAGSISLDEASIKRMIGVMEKMGYEAIKMHNAKVDAVYPEGQGFDRERALFLVPSPDGAAPPPTGNTTTGNGAAVPASIANDAEYDALPSGTEFIGPDGVKRRKP